MPTSKSAAGRKKLLLFETATRHAGIWRDAHNFLTRGLGAGYLQGNVQARAFELTELINRLENFITDTERDKHHSTATYNTVLTYLYFLAGTLQYQLAAICLHHGGSSQTVERRTAAALQKAIEHFTAALAYEACVSLRRRSSDDQRRYGRLVTMIALADLYALATKCRVCLRRQDCPCFSEDIYDRFLRYAERALAETEGFDRTLEIETRLRICALGLFRFGLTPEKKDSSGKEIGDLVHAVSGPELKIRRLLGEKFPDNRLWFLWGLKLSFYNETDRPLRAAAEREGGGWFFLMPKVPADDRAIFETHRFVLRKGWKAERDRRPRFQESWRHYVSSYWIFERLTLRAETLKSPTLRLYASILDGFYHAVSVWQDRSFDQTYWAGIPLTTALDTIGKATLNSDTKQILRINLTALYAAILIERITLLSRATYKFRDKGTRHAQLYTDASRRADANAFLAEAHQQIKALCATDIKSVPLRQRWFFHRTAADLYGLMPQTGIIKRAAAHHKRLATRGHNAAIGNKPTGDVIADDVLEFLLQGAEEPYPL